MASNKVIAVIKTVSDVVLSDKGQEFLCGKYSNGETRNVIDALRDEPLSPSTREKLIKKTKKKKKKKKKGKSQNSNVLTYKF